MQDLFAWFHMTGQASIHSIQTQTCCDAEDMQYSVLQSLSRHIAKLGICARVRCGWLGAYLKQLDICVEKITLCDMYALEAQFMNQL